MNRLSNLKINYKKNNLIQKNILYNLLEKIEFNQEHIILNEKINNQWKSFTYKNLFNGIQNCRDILKDHNINKNDKIIYKGKNSFDWLCWNMAKLSLGGVWVPIYHNQNYNYINYVLNNSDSKLMIYDDINLNELNTKKSLLQKGVINIDNSDNMDTNFIHNDVSNLIYTSGTGGKPKGVILTHENLLANINSIKLRFPEFNDKRLNTLNILPWAHIYSLNTELYYNLLNENTIYLSTEPNNFIKELKEVKPDILYLVPRVLEEIHKKLKFLDKNIIRLVIPYMLKKIFGENLKTIFIGGAKLHHEQLEFFINNKISICEGYGTTEASPMISVNHLKNPRDIESIGAILDGINVEIIDNEICINGSNITQGYYNNEEKTNESFINYNGKRYYKTGDSGYKKYNFLYYKGRLSNNYKLSNGKFIESDYIEKDIKKILKNHNFILYGENKPYNILIIEDYKNCHDELLEKINKNIPKYAKIKNLLILEKDTFSKFLTPKLSLKKKELINNYKSEINNLYL